MRRGRRPDRRSDLLGIVSLAVAILLTPSVASAHGEELLVFFFVGGVLVPAWAIFGYVSARQSVPPELRRHLGVMTLASTIVGLAWSGVGAGVLLHNPNHALAFSPLGLSIGAGPAGYVLLTQAPGRAFLLVVAPVLATASRLGADLILNWHCLEVSQRLTPSPSSSSRALCSG